MNKLILILSFLLTFGTIELSAQDNRYIKIELKNNKVITIENYKNFSFKDKGNIKRDGKIKILNDSQFCFVNYFLEPVGPTYNSNDIYQINLGQSKILGARKISAPVAIAFALFIPGGIYYLIIREVVRKTRGKQNSNSSTLEGWVDNKNFKAKIVIEYPQA